MALARTYLRVLIILGIVAGYLGRLLVETTRHRSYLGDHLPNH